jgi:hypothetical protein
MVITRSIAAFYKLCPDTIAQSKIAMQFPSEIQLFGTKMLVITRSFRTDHTFKQGI